MTSDPTDAWPDPPGQTQGQEERRLERRLYMRVILSVSIYVIFLILAVAATLTRRVEDYQLGLFGLLIAAIVLMPRQTLPSDYLSRPKDQIDRGFATRMLKLKNWLAIVRFVFFALAAFSFLLLPSLL